MSDIIKSVDRALDILLYISHIGRPVGASHLSRVMGMHKSTVFRTLITLENKQFLVQDQNTGKYSLGVSVFSMSRKIKLYDIFGPYIKALGRSFKETINVSVLEEPYDGIYRSTIVAKEENNDHALSVNPEIGSSMNCYCSGVGKCLLAFSKNMMPELFNNYNYEKHTDNTIVTSEDLVSELDRIRKRGYALDNEEQELGLTCVAVPIFDSDGWAMAAISFSGPTARICKQDINVLVENLKQVSTEISKTL